MRHEHTVPLETQRFFLDLLNGLRRVEVAVKVEITLKKEKETPNGK